MKQIYAAQQRGQTSDMPWMAGLSADHQGCVFDQYNPFLFIWIGVSKNVINLRALYAILRAVFLCKAGT